jgi:lactate dehydrogenase-like 2-hydroxyacid dehydrogenase
MKPKILVSWPLNDSTLKHFDTSLEYICIKDSKTQYEECLELIRDVDGVMSFNLTVDKKLLDKAENLKVVGNFAVGFDNIDVAYARQKNIAVSNTPHAVTMPTAELTFGLLLNLARKISFLDKGLRNQSLPSWSDPVTVSYSLQGKTIGIVGFGRIGKAVARIAQALGMNVVYYKRHQLERAEEQELKVEYKDIDVLFKQSDVVSLHLPLNQDTRHYIGEQLLSRMQPHSYLINTARGGVVEPDALYNCLSNKKIMGAGLDVFWDEPNVPERFLALDNVILTPHAGTNTKDARRNMLIELHDNISSYFRTGDVISRVV